MPFLCLYQSSDKLLVRVQVQQEISPSLDESAWTLRLTARCEGKAEGTAYVLLNFIDWRFAKQLDGPGVVRASYEEVREELRRFLDHAEKHSATPELPTPIVRPSTSSHGPVLRVAAGALALGLFMVSIGLQVLAFFIWPVVICFKRQSSLLTAAETAFLFTILDWSRPIHSLVWVALGRKRLWRSA